MGDLQMRFAVIIALLAAIGWKAKEITLIPEKLTITDKVSVRFDVVEAAYFEPFAAVLGCDLIAFSDSVNAVAKRLQVPAVWLYRAMIAESGLNPKAKNAIGAVGLIQFLPPTASDLGTSAWALRRMTATEQLQFVEKFYKPAINQIHSYGEFRLYAFFPAALKWDLNRTLTVPGLSAKEVALRNPAHDLNKDFVITKLEYLKSVGYVFTR